MTRYLRGRKVLRTDRQPDGQLLVKLERAAPGGRHQHVTLSLADYQSGVIYRRPAARPGGESRVLPPVQGEIR